MTDIGEKANARTKARMSMDPANHQASTPKVLQIYLYAAQDMLDSVWVFRDYALKAQGMLRAHNLDLRAYPGMLTPTGKGDQIIDWKAKMETKDTQEQICKQSQKFKKTPDDALPVIMCKVTDLVGDTGEMVEFFGRKFVLLYGNHVSADKVTLLHEIGHAADCRFHPPWGMGRPDKLYDFMATPGDFNMKELEQSKQSAYHRNTIFKPDVISLEKAKFAVPKKDSTYPPLTFGG